MSIMDELDWKLIERQGWRGFRWIESQKHYDYNSMDLYHSIDIILTHIPVAVRLWHRIVDCKEVL